MCVRRPHCTADADDCVENGKSLSREFQVEFVYKLCTQMCIAVQLWTLLRSRSGSLPRSGRDGGLGSERTRQGGEHSPALGSPSPAFT